ncbi:MAG TPA: NAD(P)-binding oxidoreductase [Pseudonocardia sp.]
MQVVIAGAHGKIGLRLVALLAGRGDVVTGVVRNPDHRGDVEQAGGTVAVVDLESANAEELAVHLTDADAVVFTAGAGPGSGAARKDTVDRAAAELLAEAARSAGVRRYLLVSSTGVDEPLDPGRDEVWTAYVKAKKAAEEALRATDLDWTILRPGRLTDDPGTGRVLLAPPPVERADVTRDDTAAVLAALLDSPGSVGKVLELREGEDEVHEAVAAVSR